MGKEGQEQFKRLRNRLEFYWGEEDAVIDDVLQLVGARPQSKFFEACRYKLKALFYHYQRIAELDRDYRDLVCRYISSGDFSDLRKNEDGTWSYFPFFEAIEFESILFEGKSCLDCFARAVGSAFGSPAKSLSTLASVVEQAEKQRHEPATCLLAEIAKAQQRLTGILIDPERPKVRSLRDLASHYEYAAIHFLISQNEEGFLVSVSAIVRMDHDQISLPDPNYRVPHIAGTVWYEVKELIRNTFPLVADRLKKRPTRSPDESGAAS